jgi:hypothetical protein
MHFDLRAPSAAAAEVSRLEKLGATVVRSHPGHTLMQDSEGNEFCVEPGRVIASRPQAWNDGRQLLVSPSASDEDATWCAGMAGPEHVWLNHALLARVPS